MMTFLIILGVIVFILARFRGEFQEGYRYANRKAAPIRTRMLPVPPYFRELLQKYFRYYKGLSFENKKNFERRVCNFVYAKQFIPRNMPKVPIEMAVFIAATAVQLTFGLPNVYLQHFDKILVYPDTYYSAITKRYHKGEVNPAFGIIVLSWEHFKEGFIHAEDAINLGLHEMAHALRLENIIRNEEYYFFNKELLDKFDAYANKICEDMEHQEVTFFRPYACSDVHEFFSVAAENFFERPAAFKKELPELYSVLSKLLNQDPLTVSPEKRHEK